MINTRTRDPWLLSAVIESGVLLSPPVRVKKGVAEWVVVSTRDRISFLLNLLEEKGIKHKLRSIDEFQEEKVLTDRQTEVLNLALEHGYYEIPRKITLGGLAQKLGVSKSSLSEILREAEKKLISYRGG